MSETNPIPVANPVAPEHLRDEFSRLKPIREYKGAEVYLFRAADAPAIMDEIGRIREVEYRKIGAGRNVERDIDHFDTDPDGYAQLVAWDPENAEIVGMYRFILGRTVAHHGDLSALRTSTIFEFADEFVTEYLPRSIELGRSVVNSSAKRAILGLFVVWAGLGALVNEYPWLRYLFGNVSIYADWPQAARDALLRFLDRRHRGPVNLLRARPRFRYKPSPPRSDTPVRAELSYDADYQALTDELGGFGLTVPPILISYMRAADRVETYDTALDPDFGAAYETAIVVDVESVNDKTRNRFLDNYESINSDAFRL
ncbi:MAG: GNAT family N-acetyltransferase [Spirochaetaceae bacterium]|nr:MAG: GNAT family N-acetyltransferase [Spirochaetaceae bacterium]